MILIIKNKTSKTPYVKSVSLHNGQRYQLSAGDSATLMADKKTIQTLRKGNNLLIRTSDSEEFILENFFVPSNTLADAQQVLVWADASGVQHIISNLTPSAGSELLDANNSPQITMVYPAEASGGSSTPLATPVPSSPSAGLLGLFALVGGVAATGGGGGGGGVSTLANTRIIGSPLALALASDSGADTRDSVTNNANINVQGIAAGGSWQYQVDGTAGSWLTGTGSSFTATSGMHSYFVRQIDAAGNAGAASQITSTLDTSAPDAIHAVGSASIAANGVGAVSLTADAHDVSASSSINWALGAGGDTALFTLNNGVLSFKVAPNYEMPRGAALNADTNPNTYYVYVTATDVAGNVSAPTAVAITVMDVNQAPMQAALIADQTDDQALLVDEVVSLDISGAFIDPNVEANSQAAAIGKWGTLTYAASGLPTGLNIDAMTGVIGGIATSTTDTAALVAITATDGGGLSATTSFNLEVASSTVVEGVFLGGPVLKNVIGSPLTVQAVDLKGNPIKNSKGVVITAPVKSDGTYSLNLGNNVGTKEENKTGVVTVKVVDNNGPAADYHDETTGTKSAGSNFSATVVITKGLTQTANINAITTVASKIILRSVSSSIVSLNNDNGIVNGGNDHIAIAAVSTPVNKTLVNQVNLQVGKSLLGQSVDVTKLTPTPTIKVTNNNTVVANTPPDGTPTPSVQAGKVLTLLSAAEQLPKGKALLTNLNIRLLQKTTPSVAPQNLAAAESAVSDFLSAVAALIAPSITGTSVDSELEAALQDLYIQAGARINAATDAGVITGMSTNDVDNVLQAITPASVLIVASQDVIPKNNGVLGSATVRCKFAKPPVEGSFTLADLVATGGTLSNLVWDESGTLYTVTFTPTPGTTETTATITLAANASFVVEENGVSTTYSVGGVNPLTSNSSGFVFSLGIPAPSLELDQDSGVSASDNLTNNPQAHVFGLVGGSTNSWQYQVDGGTWVNDVTGNAFSLTAGVHTYNVRQINLSETATAIASVVYTLDTTAPLAPILRLASDTGLSATDGITNNPTINVSGVESGATWVYQLDGTTGVWISGTAASFTATSGAHRYFVQQTDMAGNVGAVGVFNYTLDTSMPTGIRSVGTSGNVAENGVGAIQLTADSSVTWTLGTGLDTALFEFNNGVLSFKTAPNYEQPRGSAFNANTNNNTYTVNVIATDMAGNVSASTPLMVLVNDINEAPVLTNPTPNQAIRAGRFFSLNVANAFTEPDIEANSLAAMAGKWGTLTYSVTGLPAGLNINAATGVISGTVIQATSSFVTIIATDGGGLSAIETFNLSAVNAPVLSFFRVSTGNANIGKSGDHLTFTVTISEDVTVSVGVPSISFNINGQSVTANYEYGSGSNTLIFTGEAPAGNGNIIGVEAINLNGAIVRGLTQSLATDTTGQIYTGFTVDNTVPAPPTLSLASDTGSSASDSLTNNSTIFVNGLETFAGTSWQYQIDNSGNWITGTGASFTASAGTHSYFVRQTDAAGNTSVTSTAVTYTFDNTAIAPTLTLASDTGISASDNLTSNATINVSGLESGATWQYQVDNSAWLTGTGASFTATIGTHTYSVRQTDAAGNTSPSVAVTYTFDTTALALGLTLASDAGISASDGLTNNATIKVSGLENGATWQYQVDGTAGSWITGTASSFTASDGTHSYFVRQTDAAGNTSATSTAVTYTLDTSAPAPLSLTLASDTGSSTSDGLTSNATINVSGLESGATWQYQVDSSAWVTGTGASFTTSTGVHSYLVRQIDAAGNTSATSTAVTYTFDTSAPATPSLTLASDTGISASDNLTGNATINVSGLESGATWQYQDNGGTWVTGTASSFIASIGTHTYSVRQMDAAGNTSATNAVTYTFDNSALAPSLMLASDTGISANDGLTSNITINVSGLENGATWQYQDNGGTWLTGTGASFIASTGTHSYSVRQTDAAGNTSTTNAVTYTFDTSAPAAPTLTLASDTGSNTSDNLTSNATINVSGLENGATWQYQVDNSAWLTGTGASFIASTGTHSYSVRQTDAAGNTSATSSVATYTFDTSAPATLSLTLASDTGISASDNLTSNATINVSGLESGTTWQYQEDNSAWLTGTGASFIASTGTHSYSVRQTDAAGNTSTTNAVTYTFDTTAPAAPTLTLASDTGSNTSDNLTSNATINVSGLENGATWQYQVDSSAWLTGTGASFIASTGTHSYSVRQTDAAGNTSATSSVATYTFDTSAPATLSLTLASDTGSSASDNLTSNATINVSGLESGTTWQYQEDNSAWVTFTASSFIASTGTHSYSVRQTDAAGNTSTTNAVTYTFDTSAPAALSLTLASDTGISASDGLTSNATINVSGLETGATWQYQVDNSAWLIGTGASFIASTGTHSYSVRQTDAAGNTSATSSVATYTFDTTAPATLSLTLASDAGSGASDGLTSNAAINVSGLESGATWQYQVDGTAGSWMTGTASSFTASAGAHSYFVRQTDAAGNTSTPSTAVTYTVDTSAPDTPTLTLASDTGSSASDGLTSNATINVSGLESGATWQYQVDGSGSWATGTDSSFTASSGAHSYLVRQTDVAGHTSGASTAVTYTLDNTAPTVNTTTFSVAENTTAVGTLVANEAVTWSLAADADMSRFDLTNGVLTFKTAPNYEMPRGSAFNAANNNDAYTVNVNATDTAGNVKAQAIVVNVTDVNEAPTVIAQTPASSVSVNQAVNLNVANAFGDPDTQATDATWRTLTYVATGLPSGLSINASTGVIGGTATATTASAASVTVTATDGDGRSVTETFSLSVVAAPVVQSFTVSDTTLTNGAQLGKSGEALVFVVTMSEAVTVTPATGAGAVAPQMTFNVNGQVVTATYASGSGTAVLTFTGGTVPASGDGTAISITSIALNGGTVTGNSSAQGLVTASVGQTYAGYTVDNTALAPSLTLASDTGSSANDGLTSNATINVSGLETGATWQYQEDGSGSWMTGTASSFTASSGAHTYLVRQTDVAGNTTSTTNAVTYTLDTTAPATPSLTLASDTGSSDNLTGNATINVSGLESGATWQYQEDSSGSWLTGTASSFTASEGTHSYSVRQTDAAGNTSNASTSVTYTFDTTAPATPSLTLASDTGSSASDRLTSNATINVSGLETGTTWQYQEDSSGSWMTGTDSSFTASSGAHTYLVRQTDVAGNTKTTNAVTYTVDTTAPDTPTLRLASDAGISASDNLTSNTTINVSGLETGATWQYQEDSSGSWMTGTASSFIASEGTHSYLVRQTDAAGNTSNTSTSVTYTFDTTAPATPGLTLASDTGISANDKLTNNATINVSGLESGATWQYRVDNGTWADGTASSFTASTGSHTYLVRQTDAAGNTSIDEIYLSGIFGYFSDYSQNISQNGVYTFSRPGEEVSFVLNSQGTKLIFANGYVTLTLSNFSSFTNGYRTYATLQPQHLTYTAIPPVIYNFDTSAPATPSLTLASDTGISASDNLTNNATINVSGLENGAMWEYQEDNSAWVTFTASSFTASEGTHSYSVRQTDAAGNTNTPTSAVTYTFDTSAPATPSLTLASDTGISASDGLTSNATINVSGLENGATWQYQVDNGTTWVTGTASSFTASTGSHSYSVRQTDAAGNTSTTSTAVTYDLVPLPPDNTAPATPSLTLASDTGISASDSLTSNVTINVSGLESGATWQYQVDNGTTWVTFTASSFTASEGTHSYSVRQTDAAGNTSTTSTPVIYTFDTTAPAAPTLRLASDTGISASDGLTSNATINVSGLESGATWHYQVDGSAGSWMTGTDSSFTAITGTHSYFGRQIDAAGNTSTPSTAVTYTLDNTAPTVNSTTFSVEENTTAVGTLAANETVTWSLGATGAGTDTSRFNLTNGVLTFATAPNFEMPRNAALSAANSNAYTVNVNATDTAGNVKAQAIVVNVTDVNEAPTLTSPARGATSVLLNQAANLNVSGDFTDPDTQATDTTWRTLTYVASGLPSGLSINASTGVIGGTASATTASAASVTVTATDGGGSSVTETFDLSVVAAPTPALAAVQTLDNVGTTATSKPLDVRSALVISFNQVVTFNDTGTQTIKIMDDEGATGLTRRNFATTESVQDVDDNDVIITLVNGVVTTVTIGYVRTDGNTVYLPYTDRFDLANSVKLVTAAGVSNLVIDLKQKYATYDATSSDSVIWAPIGASSAEVQVTLYGSTSSDTAPVAVVKGTSTPPVGKTVLLNNPTDSQITAALASVGGTSANAHRGSAPFDWDFGANYHVELDAALVKNSGGLTNDAVTDATVLNFKTVTPYSPTDYTTANAMIANATASIAAQSMIMDASGANNTLTDSFVWLNGNISQAVNNPLQPTLIAINLAGGNYAVVQDVQKGTDPNSYYQSSGMSTYIKLKNFGVEDNGSDMAPLWRNVPNNDILYLDNHGDQTYQSTDGRLSAQNWAADGLNTTFRGRFLNNTGTYRGTASMLFDYGYDGGTTRFGDDGASPVNQNTNSTFRLANQDGTSYLTTFNVVSTDGKFEYALGYNAILGG